MKNTANLIITFLLFSLLYFYASKKLILFLQNRLEHENDFRYEQIIDLLIHQITTLTKDSIILFKKNIDYLLLDDPYIMRIIFLDQSNNVLLKREKTTKPNGKIYSHTIRKNGAIYGVLQLVINKEKLRGYYNKIKNKLILYFSTIYAFITFLFIWLYYYLIIKTRIKLISIFNKEPDEKILDNIKFPAGFNLLKPVLKSWFLRVYALIREKEFLHPVTGLFSYYYFLNFIENKFNNKKKSGYILIASFCGIEILKDNYGFLKYYEFLERVIGEISKKIYIMDNETIIGHLDDTSICIYIKKDIYKDISEKIITIFHNISQEMIKEHVFLKNGWARSIVFVFDIKNIDGMDNIERSYANLFRRLSNKSKKNIVYMCKKNNTDILLEL